MKQKIVVTREDLELDRSVKIQGTEYDRKRKLTDRQITYARKLLDKGYAIAHVAKLLEVTPLTIRYNTDNEFKLKWLKEQSGRHTGETSVTLADRIAYKKQLIADGKVTV